ncbi:MAG: DUF4914 family protein [Halanaerobiaceae bacterium]
MSIENDFAGINLPEEVRALLAECPNYVVADNVEQLVELSDKDSGEDGWHYVSYDLEDKQKEVVEARVCKVRNGIAANYTDPYMRRRDPNSMVIADDLPTDKVRFEERFDFPFTDLRAETFSWLKNQELCLFFFNAGPEELGINACAVAPANAGFFALGLALLQGIVSRQEIKEADSEFSPQSVIYVAPPFRHTHFDGQQVVVHNRSSEMYEMFSYNLYPGPSAKKGVYGMLIDHGAKENWPTLHCSTVQVVTPYDNRITITHEGASGGGKSEMLEDMHRQRDGRLLLGEEINGEEKRILTLPQGCELRPVADDMAAAPNTIQDQEGKLTLIDAENAWFIRVDEYSGYGTDPHLEELTCHPDRPLLFLNIDAQPKSTALIWEHIEDEPGVPCPNPRVVIPRDSMPHTIDDSVTVDIRSFGVRTPPCTRENPSYGIIGLFHVLPPALAWLWRLVSPRGYGNPSISETEGMSSEGVGSYWPFAPGKRIKQANILLEQIKETSDVRYILTPNQHIGSWKVGFMPQWLTREYLARRGGAWFTEKQIEPARSSLLGYALKEVIIEGQQLEKEFLQVEKQKNVGIEAYDQGDLILRNFFKENLEQYLDSDLLPLGKEIIECFFADGSLNEYKSFIDSEPIIKSN